MVKSLKKHRMFAESMDWDSIVDKVIELEKMLNDEKTLSKKIQLIDIIDVYENKKKELVLSRYRYYQKTYPIYGEDFVVPEDYNITY